MDWDRARQRDQLRRDEPPRRPRSPSDKPTQRQFSYLRALRANAGIKGRAIPRSKADAATEIARLKAGDKRPVRPGDKTDQGGRRPDPT